MSVIQYCTQCEYQFTCPSAGKGVPCQMAGQPVDERALKAVALMQQSSFTWYRMPMVPQEGYTVLTCDESVSPPHYTMAAYRNGVFYQELTDVFEITVKVSKWTYLT